MKNKLISFKNSLKNWLAKYYFKKSIKNKKIKILDSQKTIDLIIEKQLSFIRFGDGELNIILDKNCNRISFQKNSEKLRSDLIEVFNFNLTNKKVLLCLPYFFTGNGLEELTPEAGGFWHYYVGSKIDALGAIINPNLIYGNTQITRPYIDLKNKKDCKHSFDSLKKLWNKKDVLIIEGELTRFGVDNDLLSNATSINRIIVPSVNAYDLLPEITNSALKHSSGKVILLSIGPAAKVLAMNLIEKGLTVYDVGHLDIEYEWFLRSAEKKIPIPNKYVNETKEKFISTAFNNQVYRSEIIEKIL